MTEKKFQYKKAMREIESIVNRIENEEPDVDELSELVKKAAVLIKKCKEKLRETSDDLENTLKSFDEE
jgi:exodeoxyribonuclease VII small subunit